MLVFVGNARMGLGTTISGGFWPVSPGATRYLVGGANSNGIGRNLRYFPEEGRLSRFGDSIFGSTIGGRRLQRRRRSSLALAGVDGAPIEPVFVEFSLSLDGCFGNRSERSIDR